MTRVVRRRVENDEGSRVSIEPPNGQLGGYFFSLLPSKTTVGQGYAFQIHLKLSELSFVYSHPVPADRSEVNEIKQMRGEKKQKKKIRFINSFSTTLGQIVSRGIIKSIDKGTNLPDKHVTLVRWRSRVIIRAVF